MRFRRREQDRRDDEDEWGLTDTSRDWEMEWRLLQIVAPQEADEIEREAEREAGRAN